MKLNATKIRPLRARHEEWNARLEMIRSARSFLYATSFYLEYDSYGLQFLRELEAAQRRGVQVTLLLDTFGQRLGNVVMTRNMRRLLAQEFNALREIGGKVIFYRAPHFFQRLLGGGHHVKIQLSEKGSAIFGSSNITKTSFEKWEEFSVLVEGPIVLELLATLDLLGARVRVEDRDRLVRSLTKPRKAHSVEYIYFDPNAHQSLFGPLFWRQENSLSKKMESLIDKAQKHVAVSSFYFKPIPRLLDALLRAVRRGVQVEVFHSGKSTLEQTELAWIAAATKYPYMLRHGIQIYEHTSGEHSKLVLIDDSVAAFGSYNFEDAAHDRLAEAMLITQEKNTIAQVARVFDSMRKDVSFVEVTLDSWSNYSLATRLRVKVLGIFKRWM